MPAYSVEGIIENVDTKRFKNAGVRFRVLLSIPVQGNEELYLQATKNIGNVVDANLTILQVDLFSAAAANAAGGEGPDPDEDDGELGGIFTEPQEENSPLVNSLLDGAQEPNDEDRAQAMANLTSESSIEPDPEPDKPTSITGGRGRRGIGTGAQLRE